MTTSPNIERLRIEAGDRVDPHLLVVALQRRLAGQTWVPGPENNVATAVRSAVDTHQSRGES